MFSAKNPVTYLLLATLLTLTSQCQPNSTISDLTTGLVTFQIPTKNETTQSYSYQTYNLTVPRKSDRNSQISYSFAIKDAFTLTSSVMYFDLLVLQTCEANLVVNFIYQPNKWTKISYNYLLSYRNDLYLGVQTFLQSQFAKSPQGYSLRTGITISQQNKERDYIVMAFVNGLRYRSQENSTGHYLNFAFTEQFVQNSTIVVAFTGLDSPDIISLTFSYVAYAPSLVRFGSYGGTINEHQFRGRSAKNLHYLFPNYHFQAIYGLSALQANQSAASTVSYQSQLSKNYSFSFQVNQWQILRSVQISYLVFGVMPSKICQKVTECQTQQNVYIFQQKCVQSCPKQTKPITYVDGGVECRECPPNQSFSNLTNKCECTDGYTLDNSKNCIPKPQPQAKTNAGVTNAQQSNGDSLDSGQPSLADCLSLVDIQQSNKNVFIRLKASSLTLNDLHGKDNGFIKVGLTDNNTVSSYFCHQCQVQPQNYECLLFFANDVPTNIFTMQFKAVLTIKGQPNTCSLSVPYKSIKAGQ